MATRMQQRRGTESQWTTANPILAAGEIGFESDTGQFKIGDGINHWDDIPYFKNLDDLGGTLDDYVPLTQKGANGGVATLDAYGHIPVSQLSNLIDGAPEALDTLKEIADAVTLVNDHTEETTNVHGIPDTADLVSTGGLAETLSNYEAKADLATDIGGYITTHNNDTTNVHGITDTSALATKTYADDAAQGVQDNLDSHNSETENVHGISDTAALVTLTGTETLSNKTINDPSVNVTVGGLPVSLNMTDLTYVNGVTSAIQTQLDAKATPSDISDHNSDTTSVHGIADTSKIVMMDAASVTLDGDLTVDGDFTVNGTNFAASATTITIEDNIVQLAHQNPGNTVDLGLVVGYNDGLTGTLHAGIVRDVSDSKWKLFKDVATEPTTTVAFGEGSLDTLAVGNIEVTGVVFSDGTQTKEGVPSRTPIISKTADYTLSALTERDSLIEVDSSSAVTITIPTNSAVAFPIGTTLDILGVNTGLITIAGDTGVTVNSTPGLKLRTQWSSCTLFKRAENSWVVYGDLKA